MLNLRDIQYAPLKKTNLRLSWENSSFDILETNKISTDKIPIYILANKPFKVNIC